MAAFDDEVQPFTLPVITENIPAKLKVRPQWVAYRMEMRAGKSTKVPVNIHTHGMAKTNAPDTWAPFAKVQPAYESGAYPGPGFVFSAKDPFCFIDIDDCRDPETGEITALAKEIIEPFFGTYIEVSTSGTGLRIFGEGELPGTQHTKALGDSGSKIEFYDRLKYSVVTGNWLPGSAPDVMPCQPALDALCARVFGQEGADPIAAWQTTTVALEPLSDDDEVRVAKARASKGGAAFVELYDLGNAGAYGNDHSRADQALANKLAFWGDADPQRVDRLFRSSALYRPKWDEVHGGDSSTYGEMTIAKAVASCPEPYRPSQPRPNLRVVPETISAAGRDADGSGASPDTGPDRTSDVDSDGRTVVVICAQDQNVVEVSREAWRALEKTNDPPALFVFGGMPSRITTGDDGVPAPQPLTEDRMQHELARRAFWWRKVKDPETGFVVQKHARPPRDVARDMLAAPAYPLPVLTRITRMPTFASDGSLPTKPGYHAPGRTYFSPGSLVVPVIPDRPTAAQIDTARRLIVEDLLGDFPFAGAADRAHAVAMLMLPVMRDLIDGPTPLTLIDKPAPGTGASLLTNVVARVVTGREPSVMTEARDEDEWRKRLTAALRGSPEVILIDNVRRPLDSAALSAAITTTEWADRLLGASETLRLPVRCAWVATGNNPTVSSEIARRVVRIRLDAHQDRPWLRTVFRHSDIVDWVMSNRAKLVAACLTIGQAWIAAGQPIVASKMRLGSFEAWSRVMAGVLEVAGVPGFLDNLREFYDQADVEGNAYRAFISRWWEEHHEVEKSAADLFEMAVECGIHVGNGTDRSQRTVFGTKLRALRDQQYTLENEGRDVVRVSEAGKQRKGMQLWRLQKGLPAVPAVPAVPYNPRTGKTEERSSRTYTIDVSTEGTAGTAGTAGEVF